MEKQAFTAELYHAVNREERCFIALVAHAALASAEARASLCQLISAKEPNNRVPPVNLDPGKLEVYVEAACLRDYWRALGPPLKMTPETQVRRLAILELILESKSIPSNVLHESGMFWTGGRPGAGKPWSPGHWATKFLQNEFSELVWVKRAFNAHPDLMLVSGSSAALIEAKVESPPAPMQLRVLAEIANLLGLLAPIFNHQPPGVFPLKMASHSGLSWSEVVHACRQGHLDHFTDHALRRLETYPNYHHF